MNERDIELISKAWTEDDLVRYFNIIELVRADEREACAKVCENGINNATDWDSSAWDQACENRAWAIRARGNNV
jgi:hypothetical protein